MHHYSNKCEPAKITFQHLQHIEANTDQIRWMHDTTNALSHTYAINNAGVVIITVIIVITNRNTAPNVRNTQEHTASNAAAGYNATISITFIIAMTNHHRRHNNGDSKFVGIICIIITFSMIVIIIVIIAISKHIINQHLQRIEANTDTSQAQTP